MRQSVAGGTVFFLNVQSMELFGLIHYELQCWGTRDILRGTELSGIGVRVIGAALSQTELLEEAIVLFLIPSPLDSAGELHI